MNELNLKDCTLIKIKFSSATQKQNKIMLCIIYIIDNSWQEYSHHLLKDYYNSLVLHMPGQLIKIVNKK